MCTCDCRTTLWWVWVIIRLTAEDTLMLLVCGGGGGNCEGGIYACRCTWLPFCSYGRCIFISWLNIKVICSVLSAYMLEHITRRQLNFSNSAEEFISSRGSFNGSRPHSRTLNDERKLVYFNKSQPKQLPDLWTSHLIICFFLLSFCSIALPCSIYKRRWFHSESRIHSAKWIR